jgi:alpha-tubulin suppressor-like RCC1 family protein
MLTATAKDAKGKDVTVPFAWKSSAESVAVFDPNGRLLARDTGVTSVTASSLGVNSPPIAVRVVWQGAADVAALNWVAPAAATPNTRVADSIRARVTNRVGGPAAGAVVVFDLAAGGGKLSATRDTSDANGIVSTSWTLGPTKGLNSIRATVVDDDGNLVPWVTGNPVTLSVTTFQALTVVAGGGQTAQILSDLPVTPSVRLVDSLGNPRQGIPVVFTPANGGRVASPVVSTGADGVASPGVWTLGDAPGDQTLVAQVESAELTIGATATGTPIHFTATSLNAGGSATCAIISNGLVSCWGATPLVGDGSNSNRSAPTPTKGGLAFSSIDGGPSHFCGVATDQSIECWGTDALVDTSGKTVSTNQPTRLPSAIHWTSVATGLGFNCALAADQSASCWGTNSAGQLGDRDTLTTFVPTAVSGGFNFTAVAAGSAHACALTLDRSAFCWGSNANGQLGDGTVANRVAPTVVGGGQTFQSIGAGQAWTCGLTTTGKAYCWGGIPGGSAAQTTPQTYVNAPTFTSLSVGGAHACALTGDGTAYCWGANNSGQLGDSTTTTRTVPTPVAGGLKFQSISAGDSHTCAETADGSVACWGLNRAGELGNNTTAFQTTPRFIVLGVNP